MRGRTGGAIPPVGCYRFTGHNAVNDYSKQAGAAQAIMQRDLGGHAYSLVNRQAGYTRMPESR